MIFSFRTAVLLGGISLAAIAPLSADEAAPRVLDGRLQLECVLDSPAVATPTGLEVDSQGRVWVIENNTHFRPGTYSRHPQDRILVFQPEKTASGQPAKPGELPVVVFKDDLKNSMSLLLGERDPLARDATKKVVFIATRSQILQCRDFDGDGRCDETKVLANFETAGNYPHNGLSGLAWHPSGKLIFGCGENLGATYELKGADGTIIPGGGEGGNVYRCDIDGNGLERVATGFWNPYASAFTKAGDWFTVDNDPDSRPPCRLLHVIEGGDYGYRFRNGRKGTHPFTSWNGEIPGTLPMVCGTGEAPSGIIVHSGNGFPGDYAQSLLVTSWGDHRIEQYTLKPRGTSFGAEFKTVVIGGEDFRPVSIQQDASGNVYFSDWVKRDYQLHGQGRVWKLSSKDPQVAQPVATGAPSATPDSKDLADPFVFSRRLRSLVLSSSVDELAKAFAQAGTQYEAEVAFLAIREAKSLSPQVLEQAAKSPYVSVRRLLVQAVAEDRLANADQLVDQVLAGEVASSDLFLASLAARAMLGGQSAAEFEKAPPSALAKPFALDPGKPLALRTRALELLDPNDPALKEEVYRQDLLTKADPLRSAAVRLLGRSNQPFKEKLLCAIATDESQPLSLRLDALTGLIQPIKQTSDPSKSTGNTHQTLARLLQSQDPAIQAAAIRALRGTLARSLLEQPALAAQVKQLQSNAKGEVLAQLELALSPTTEGRTPQGWDQPGDVDAGRRIFFALEGALCAKCHRVDGAGGNVGPDLSAIARTMNRQKLAESIIDPSREISPQFSTLVLELDDGRMMTGMLADGSPKGMIRIRDTEGKTHDVALAHVEEQGVSRESLMPKGLVHQLTDQDFRDLLTYLETLK